MATTSGLSTLYRVPASEARRAGEVAARAFRDDPLFAALIPDRVTLRETLPHLFEFAIRYAIRYGEVYSTSERLQGVTAWLPHDRVKIPLLRALRAGVLRLVSHVDLDILMKFLAMDVAVEEAHFRLADFPHWYLSLIAVEPDLQGQGIGSLLLKPMLARLDRELQPCYLETQNPGNVSMYEHYGFRTLEEFLPDGGPAGWAMLREPRAYDRGFER